MQTRDDAYDHLLLRSFPLGYTIWLHHGEKLVEERSGLGRVDENPISQVNQMHQMVNKAFNFTLQHESEDTTTIEHAEDDEDVLPYLYEGPSHMFQVPMESTLHSKEMKLLACGSMIQAKYFGTYNVNGHKFRTITKEDGLKTQNSRVYVSSNTRSYASMCDNRVLLGVPVNFSRPIHTGNREDDEPYILSSEAQLVYYADDEVAKEWNVVVHVKPRDLYDMGEENEKAELDFSP
ncbi:hypothetical protein Ahy_B02g058546 [Arachis hypogaea]|uniref:Uncharacterized protein n=1 Tax=Arachis hypogaea TaxID=3818 RepID=A0A445AEU1_ARAHY|nr:hypothetical protein Ahy_B02g058546 [Arachis hypogaea]